MDASLKKLILDELKASGTGAAKLAILEECDSTEEMIRRLPRGSGTAEKIKRICEGKKVAVDLQAPHAAADVLAATVTADLATRCIQADREADVKAAVTEYVRRHPEFEPAFRRLGETHVARLRSETPASGKK